MSPEERWEQMSIKSDFDNIMFERFMAEDEEFRTLWSELMVNIDLYGKGAGSWSHQIQSSVLRLVVRGVELGIQVYGK